VPALSEFLWRFPHFEARLRRQVQLHWALSHDARAPASPGGTTILPKTPMARRPRPFIPRCRGQS
jgi:hypothetical protein